MVVSWAYVRKRLSKTDELYRNHLSLIKAHVPERGRNVTLLYNVRF